MTKTVRRKLFKDFVGSLPSEEVFLKEHPFAALLVEPIGAAGEGWVNTPPEPHQVLNQTCADQTIGEVIVAANAFSKPSDLVHPEARVLWLVKSDRNPFAEMIMLGRAKNNDLVFQHSAISKMHAIFHRADTRWQIEDRASTNGTFLDGLKLPPNEIREINDGCSLRFANVVVARFFEPSSLWTFCTMVRGLVQPPTGWQG